eukprot:TRINITY_DN14014_c0_g1_i1.p2 TRINITY_DN14014_c0_g1~~TRINITY_DN14014_c0_g1_i1.p2  ORF type:complete len:105 (+),score=26.41 TRINITY_DN14014_c0_g1_i1:229-543(+)
MAAATRGNVRTAAAAAASDGLGPALNVAFRSGAVMGLSVVSLGLGGVSGCYLMFRDVRALAGFAAGASTVALFCARLGGGSLHQRTGRDVWAGRTRPFRVRTVR